MRLKIVSTVFKKELTELLRNRRTLLVMFGVPLLLYPLLTIAVASLANSKNDQLTKKPARVFVQNADGAPHLLVQLRADDSGIRIISPAPTDVEAPLKNGSVDAVIQIPPNFESAAIAGPEEDELRILVDRSHPDAGFAEKKLDKIFDQYQQWIIQRRLAKHDLPASLAQPPKRTVTDIATTSQTFGRLAASVLPLLLLITGMLGAVYPALNATTTERELGTLETLLVTSATRDELLAAKAGIVLLMGLLTALLNLVSMSLVLMRAMSQADKSLGQITIDPAALALVFLAAVPTLIFFSALVLMVGLLSRNLREANAYATPLMILPVASMLVGIADPPTTPALLMTPIVNTTLIIRDILIAHTSVGAFAIAFISSAVYAVLVLSFASRIFTNEQLVNPAWEPLSFHGLSKHRTRRPRYPALDEAISLFVIAMLLLFYVTPSFLKFGLIAVLLVSEAVIAGPALLFGWLGHYKWQDVFSFRIPNLASMTGAVLLGVGVIPLIDVAAYLQQRFHILPYNPADMEGIGKLFEPALESHPIFVPLLIGLAAGICEELLFRGPLQCALVRRLPVRLALFIGGFLFAAAHMDISGLPVRLVLGVLLGWTVWHTGSIFPAMLLHATIDTTNTAVAAHQLVTSSASADLSNPLGTNMDRLVFLLGIILTLAGWLLIRYFGAGRVTSEVDAGHPILSEQTL